ncbi:MAG: endo-1,4-beta-xylanase [Planctomycetota bacterium]
MLRFTVFENGAPARSLSLDGAHLLGADHVPVRSEIRLEKGELVCDARSRGAAALALMWSVEGVGRILLETPRVLDRPEPYHLHVELARGQLMRISQKREDWGFYDHPQGKSLYDEIDKARDLLVEALAASDGATAAKFADQSLTIGVKIGESLSTYHADVNLPARKENGTMPALPLGCRIDPTHYTDAAMPCISEAFQFVELPFTWASLQPAEGKYETGHLEKALQHLKTHKMPIRGCSLLSFEPWETPDWLVKVAKDYDRLREAIMKHLRTVIRSFGGHVQSWEVCVGLHAYNPFKLSFEQLVELTRMSAILSRQSAPKSEVILGLVLPWGEYYANDPQSIPPTLYAEMALQSGVNFDAFSVQLQFGGQHTAQYVRDLLQISSILDRIGSYGKPVHVSCAGVPSDGMTPMSGYWHDEWNEQVQSNWLRDIYRIALSKSFVESVSWQSWADGVAPSPWGGLQKKDGSRKKSYQELLSLRSELMGASA